MVDAVDRGHHGLAALLVECCPTAPCMVDQLALGFAPEDSG
ncbi:hypothetical protein DVDV_3848 [Desulfovibrio sp. DV]|nr:hypothetical protein DVDV_3848 [Desulfovibrio sp. DV]